MTNPLILCASIKGKKLVKDLFSFSNIDIRIPDLLVKRQSEQPLCQNQFDFMVFIHGCGYNLVTEGVLGSSYLKGKRHSPRIVYIVRRGLELYVFFQDSYIYHF